MAKKATEPGTRPGSEPSPASSMNSATHSPSLERHRRKCTVCKHAERDAIEEAFLHWISPEFITKEFELPDWSTLYRHAHATGLFAQRRRNVRFALENVIERSVEVEITAAGLVRAIRAYASLTDSGEWVEPASRVIVSSGTAQSWQRLAHVASRPISARRCIDLHAHARKLSHFGAFHHQRKRGSSNPLSGIRHRGNSHKANGGGRF